MRICAAFLMIVTLVSVAPGLGGSRVLVDTRYTPDPVVSRVAFNFSGTGRVLHTRLNDKQFRLTFPDATTARSTSLTPLILAHGPAKSVSFDMPDSSTIRAVVTLRQAADYALRREGSNIIVDLHPTELLAEEKPVDIAAMVTEQVQQAKTPTPVVNGKTESGTPLGWPLVIAVATALFGTGGLLLFLNRRGSKRQPLGAPPAPRKEAPNSIDAILQEARIILEEKAAQDKSHYLSVQSEDSGTKTARTFRRGRGEIAFALNIEQQRREVSRKTTGNKPEILKGKPLTTAKQLGVGRGEVDLARALQKFSQKQQGGK